MFTYMKATGNACWLDILRALCGLILVHTCVRCISFVPLYLGMQPLLWQTDSHSTSHFLQQESIELSSKCIRRGNASKEKVIKSRKKTGNKKGKKEEKLNLACRSHPTFCPHQRSYITSSVCVYVFRSVCLCVCVCVCLVGYFQKFFGSVIYFLNCLWRQKPNMLRVDGL